jgi:hypothetical protein
VEPQNLGVSERKLGFLGEELQPKHQVAGNRESVAVAVSRMAKPQDYSVWGRKIIS